MAELDYDYVLKVLVVGDASVGKTSLLKRYTLNKIPESYMVTLGVNFEIKTIFMPEIQKTTKMQMWDTAGQERFQSLTKSFWHGCKGAVIVFSLVDRASFEHAKTNWYKAVSESTHDSCEYAALVGNKCDLATESGRQVTTREAQEFAAATNMTYVETSALTNDNVEKMFYNFCLNMTSIIVEKNGAVEQAARDRQLETVSLEPPAIAYTKKSECSC